MQRQASSGIGPDASRNAAGPFVRNSTSFGAQVTARLRRLHDEYLALRAQGEGNEAAWAHILKYYQFLVRAVMGDPEYGLGADGNGRGLLVYATMGMGKTRLAVAVMMALWERRDVVVLLARSLQRNFRDTVAGVAALLNAAGHTPRIDPEAAVARVAFVSMDAYNSADQLERGGRRRADRGAFWSGDPRGLDNKLLIIDEAHNLCRAIINGGSGSADAPSNARRIYDTAMSARNLRILALTGSPASKDPFELVPLFNMLAGSNILPSTYEAFYDLYVDRSTPGGPRVRNRGPLANRLVGLVSHVTHGRSQTVVGRDGAAAAAPGDEGPAPGEEGWFPVERPLVVERVEMGPEQYKRYTHLRALEDSEGRARGRGPGLRPPPPTPALALPGSERKSASTYHVRSRCVSNFYQPADPKNPDHVVPVAALPDEAFSASAGPKLALIADRAAAAPGPVLVYSQFVGVGGLRPLARYLEARGFEPFPVEGAAVDAVAAAEAALIPEDADQGSETPAERLRTQMSLESALERPAKMNPTDETIMEMSTANERSGGGRGRREAAAQNAFRAEPVSPDENLAAAQAVLEAMPAYTAEERAKIMEIVIDAGTLDPWLSNLRFKAPFPYRSNKGAMVSSLFNQHSGQRKLFVAELQALLALIKRPDKKAVVVYAGAAPGNHLPLISELFPNVQWHLYDPAAFEFTGRESHLHKHQEYFTDDVARSWAGECDVFICDIRIGINDWKGPGPAQNENPAYQEAFEAQIRVDMAAQERWTRIMVPRAGASLKFRPPYVENNSDEVLEYLPGRILKQTWPSKNSSETRLIVRHADLAAPAAKYSAKSYQDWCAYHNQAVRAFGEFGETVPGVPGYDRCFDCANEARAWADYISTAGPGAGAQSVNGEFIAPPARIGHYMNRLTAAIHQKLLGRAPPYHGIYAQLPSGARNLRILVAAGKPGGHPSAYSLAKDLAALPAIPSDAWESARIRGTVREAGLMRDLSSKQSKTLVGPAPTELLSNRETITGSAEDPPEDPPEFPWRRNYMPPFAEMFARLTQISGEPLPPAESTIPSRDRKHIRVRFDGGIFERSFPDDYESTDSIADHFTEPARVLCKERGRPSPLEAWRRAVAANAAVAALAARDAREHVYKLARGCNLFNAALGVHLFRRQRARRVLDCTAGWGDRLVAAGAAGAEAYLGWDTNPDLTRVYEQLADAVNAARAAAGTAPMRARVHTAPFESAAARFAAGGDLRGQFDTVFIGPPFFDKELYTGADTSTAAYPTRADWDEKFYHPLLRAAFAALAPGGSVIAYIPHDAMWRDAERIAAEFGASRGPQVGFSQRWGPGAHERSVRYAFIWIGAGARRDPETAFTLPDFSPRAATGGSDTEAVCFVGGAAVKMSKAMIRAYRELGDQGKNMFSAIIMDRNRDVLRNEPVDWMLPALAEARRRGLLVSFARPEKGDPVLKPDALILPELGVSIRPGGRLIWASTPTIDARSRSWISFAHREGLRWADKNQTHIIGYRVDRSRLCHLATEKEAYAFGKKYGVCPPYADPVLCDAQTFIDWERVAQDWGGIAVDPYLYSTNTAVSGPNELKNWIVWYMSLDAVTYVIWDSSVISEQVELYAPPTGKAREDAEEALFSKLLATGGDESTTPMFSVDGRRFYDTQLTWELSRDEPAQTVATRDIAWMLDAPRWASAAVPGHPAPTVTPRAVLADPTRYADHWRRMEATDLKWPILVVDNGVAGLPPTSPNFTIADGMHRLMRAVRDGTPSVRVAYLTPAILKRALALVEDGERTGGAAGPARKKRYAIISGEVPPAERDRICAIERSPENAHGELIAALLVSKTGAEGLDLKWIRETHQLEPYWDRARGDQVRARGVRLGSHDGLPREERVVQPYLYLAVANRAVAEHIPAEEREPKTIDEQFWDRATEKWQLCEQFRTLLAEVSLECELFGYGGCRRCVPTGEPLWRADPALDTRLPDPCRCTEPKQVEAVPVRVGDREYYAARDESSVLKWAFYEYREDLDAYAPIDPSSAIVSELLGALETGAEAGPADDN